MATVEQAVPPFIEGMQMTREEFLRRWELHPEIEFAELIGGEVYIPSPLSIDHGDMDADVGHWIATYKTATPGTKTGHNTTAFLLQDAPQADINLRILPEYGGASRVERQYLAGAVEFITEICKTSRSYDLHEKLELYQAAGVQEYLVVLLREQEIRWHQLMDGVYQILPADADGIWRSRVFPGLWLDGKALLQGDMQRVLAVLQEGISSPEHQMFVERLKSQKK
jgi:Uma2 family endonuclease